MSLAVQGLIEIVQPGIGATVQDNGRAGHRHEGIPLSGWLDAPLAEAANALVQLGLSTHVVEMAPRLMPVQLDEAAGQTLVRHIEGLGVSVHAGVLTEAMFRSVFAAVRQHLDGR